MRRTLFIIVVAGIALLSGCGDSASPPAAPLPRFNMEGDCQMDAVTCSHIAAGIQYLKNHWNADCRRFGQSAEDRFNAPTESGMGFRPGEVPNKDMGVEMYPTPGVTTSGYSPTNGVILVTNQFVNNPNAGNDLWTGGLIAHEEGGHMTGDDGLGHNTGLADFYQDTCINRYGD